jgi:uncharacterized protein
MPKQTSYTQGTPCWVDLQTSDQAAAKAFYAGLFGWTYDDQPMDENTVYSMGQIEGDSVAAIAPQNPAMAGAPPTWNTYIAVDSVDDSAAKVASAGGQIAMPPFDVPDAGRMAFVLDPGGAAVGLWQANKHIGAERVNEPGTISWNELVTADPAASLGFYNQVIGMTSSDQDMGDGNMYTVFEATDKRQVGGATKPYAEGTPNHWHVYFGTASTDATAAKAAELGGTVLVAPFDIPVGRIAVVQDPQGAVFSLFQISGAAS